MMAQEVPDPKIRPMAIVPGANPIEVFLLVVSIILSFVYVVGGPPPQSLEIGMPTWAIIIWYANLGIGGTIGLVGGTWKRKIRVGGDESPLRNGLVAYAIGWGYVGTASVTYGLLILLKYPATGFVAGLTTVAWGLASLVRAYQVRRLLLMRGGGKHRHD